MPEWLSTGVFIAVGVGALWSAMYLGRIAKELARLNDQIWRWRKGEHE